MGKLHEISRNSNDRAAAQKIIDGGADVNEKDNLSSAPLHYASRYGNIDVAETLLASKATIDITNNKGQTPLYQATVGEHGHIVQLLLDHNANPNLISATGYSVLHYAARNGLIGITKKLLNARADYDAKTAEGQSARDLAVKMEQKTVVAILDKFMETGTFDGVVDVELEEADEEEAQIMRELQAIEIQPEIHKAGTTPDTSPSKSPRKSAGHVSSPTLPKEDKTATDAPEGYGKVVLGAPAPHMMKKMSGPPPSKTPPASSPSKQDDIENYSYPPSPAGDSDMTTYDRLNRNSAVPSDPSPEAMYDNHEAGDQIYDNGEANTEGGQDIYDNNDAHVEDLNTSPDLTYSTSADVRASNAAPATEGVYKEAELWNESGDVYSEATAITEPDYASISDVKGKRLANTRKTPTGGPESMSAFLGRLGIPDACLATAEEAGIDTPEDFKLFSEAELVKDYKFKVGHVRKILKALDK